MDRWIECLGSRCVSKVIDLTDFLLEIVSKDYLSGHWKETNFDFKRNRTVKGDNNEKIPNNLNWYNSVRQRKSESFYFDSREFVPFEDDFTSCKRRENWRHIFLKNYPNSNDYYWLSFWRFKWFLEACSTIFFLSFYRISNVGVELAKIRNCQNFVI